MLNATALEVDRSENKIAYNEQRSHELAGRGGQIAAEITTAAAQVAEWESRNSAQIESVTSLRAESTDTDRQREWADGARADARVADS